MSSESGSGWKWIAGILGVVGVVVTLVVLAAVGWNPLSRRGRGREAGARSRTEQPPPPPAKRPPPRARTPEAAFAAFVHDAERAVVAVARRMPNDPRWDRASFGADLRLRVPENYTALEPLGEWHVVATVLEVEAVTQADSGAGYLRSNVIVFPDGRVRFLYADVRRQTRIFAQETVGLAQAAPELAAFVEQTITQLRSPDCGLEVATDAELANLPRVVMTGRNVPLAQACEVARGLGDAAVWRPRYDDLYVLVTGNGEWAMLRTSFEMEETRLTLRTLRAAVIRQESQPLPAPRPASAPAPSPPAGGEEPEPQ